MRKLYRKIRAERGAIRYASLVDANGRAVESAETARRFTRAREAQSFADQALARRATQVVEIIKTSGALDASLDREHAPQEGVAIFDPSAHAQ